MAETAREAVTMAGGNLRAVLPYADLREWLVEAEKLGEVTVAKGLGKEEEIGQAAELVMHSDEANCVVFDEIPGHEPGYRVLVNFFGGKRKNMTLGFPTDLSKIELSEAYYDAQLKDMTPIPYEEVERGPVTENVFEGDDVDLGRFPAPFWHPDDGGHYIGTGSYDVTVDPDTGWMNLGTYRVMVQDEKTVGYYISPGKHGRVHRDKYLARGEAMPTVIVVGGDPMTFLTACTEMPPGVCEYDIVGAMRGEPLKVIRGRHTGIPFPADAEIVLEGFVDPEERRPEGAVRRVDRLLRLGHARRAGDARQGGLSPQQPDHPRLPAAAPAGRDVPLPRGDPLGDAARRDREGRRAGRARRLGARGGQQPDAARGRHQAALSRPRETGRPRRRDVPCRRLCRQICRRHRRGCRHLQPGGDDLGDDHPVRPGHLDRHHQGRLVDPRSIRASRPRRRPRAT